MKNKYKLMIIFFVLLIYNFVINYFSISNNDLIWNYGFCYNFAKGMKLYSDFNMVITPLYPTIFGLILKIFGNNMIIFYLSNAIMPTIISYIVYKNYNKAFIPTLIILSFVSNPNYNLLCMMFLFILFYLEDKNKNDYVIGIVLGLVFLTKSSMGLLLLASLYYFKDFKKVFKRFIGFLVPNIIFLIYFYFNNSLYDYINYAFGSLISFATKNYRSSIGLIIFIITILYLINVFRKNKDIIVLYIMLFQIMSYPIFNLIHILISLVPVIFYIFLNCNNKYYLKYNKYLSIILICPLLSSLLQYTMLDMKEGTNALKYKKIEAKYYNDAMILKNNLNSFNDVYFIMYEAYYNKLLLGLDINKYDLLLMGNMGYNGEDNVIKYFDSSKNGTKFVMFKEYEGGQASLKIYNHIKDNYKLYKSFDKYDVYVKK